MLSTKQKLELSMWMNVAPNVQWHDITQTPGFISQLQEGQIKILWSYITIGFLIMLSHFSSKQWWGQNYVTAYNNRVIPIANTVLAELWIVYMPMIMERWVDSVIHTYGQHYNTTFQDDKRHFSVKSPLQISGPANIIQVKPRNVHAG